MARPSRPLPAAPRVKPGRRTAETTAPWAVKISGIAINGIALGSVSMNSSAVQGISGIIPGREATTTPTPSCRRRHSTAGVGNGFSAGARHELMGCLLCFDGKSSRGECVNTWFTVLLIFVMSTMFMGSGMTNNIIIDYITFQFIYRTV